MLSITQGVSTWEAYKPGVIRRDTPLITEDVFVSDYTEVSIVFAKTSSYGKIMINDYHFKTMTSDQRQKTATHELGHALGLDHTWGTSDIMQQGLLSLTQLSSADKTSYDEAYKTY